ncbi:MASE3 domain-containing protein [Endothiovibrio diazotrophicus]
MPASPSIAASLLLSPPHGRLATFVWLPPLLMALFLGYLSRHNGLLFHTLAELFTVAIGILAAVVAWNTYPFSRNHLLMFLGSGYFWVGMLDLIHTLSFEGMGLYPLDTANHATQFWIAARGFEALLLLAAPSFLRRPFPPRHAFLAFAAVSLGLYWLILHDRFPDAYVEGYGLTPFKIYSEYLIIALLALALARLWRHRGEIGLHQRRLLGAAILLTMAAEFLFTNYMRIDDPVLTAGHLAKIASYWLLFVAVVRLTLTEPFRAMAHDATSYDAIPDPTVVVDGSGEVRSVNRAARLLVDRPAMQCVDRPLHALFHAPDSPRGDCPVCRAIDRGEPNPAAPIRLRRGARSYDVVLSPIQSADGIAGMVHVMRDVTEEAATQQALESSEARYREIMACAGDAVLIAAPDERIVDANPKAEELLGYRRDELLGLRAERLHPEAEWPEVKRAFATLARGENYLGQQQIRHKDGEAIAVEIHAAPLRLDGRDYIVGIFRDLRERLAMEARERDLEARLIRAERLTTANEITTTLAHELNQPLAAVVNFAGGCANRLRRGEVDPEQLLPILEQIAQQGRQAGATIHRLRALLRGDPSEPRPVEATLLTGTVAALLDGKLRRQGVRLHHRLDHLPPLLGDPLQLQQMLINLVVNAIDAVSDLPAARRVVEIDGRPLEGETIELRVRDCGPGVAEEELARIFEPFHSTKEGALGMGLAACRTIAEAHRGRIEAHNDGGLVVRVVLPAAVEGGCRNGSLNRHRRSCRITSGQR